MLVMAAFQFRHPVLLVVLVKSDDSLIHDVKAAETGAWQGKQFLASLACFFDRAGCPG
jgi:hypothetical protein